MPPLTSCALEKCKSGRTGRPVGRHCWMSDIVRSAIVGRPERTSPSSVPSRGLMGSISLIAVKSRSTSTRAVISAHSTQSAGGSRYPGPGLLLTVDLHAACFFFSPVTRLSCACHRYPPTSFSWRPTCEPCRLNGLISGQRTVRLIALPARQGRDFLPLGFAIPRGAKKVSATGILRCASA